MAEPGNAPSIKALIFDFDGTILDTETPDYRSWEEVYRSHGCELPLSLWALTIGTTPSPIDEVAYLSEQIGRPLDPVEVRARRRERYYQMVGELPLQPGVVEFLSEARRMGLKIAVASSSNRSWVSGHLERLGIAEYFDCLRTSEDVSRTKPDPELFTSALAGLDVYADEAIVIEDSPNGILAAKGAGIFCVAIPNEITGQLDLSGADLRISSLEAMGLEELIEHVRNGRS